MQFEKINYNDLNAKQKEKYNYQKVSAVLADYGFITIPLSDDWNGADFLAIPIQGEILKIQLKGRLTFMKKYLGKNLHICFREDATWYLYPHDDFFELINSEIKIQSTQSWIEEGAYSFANLSNRTREALNEFQL